MRRFWLSLLLAFTFAANGFAAAAEVCPMARDAVASTAHACCPDQQPSGNAPQKQKSDNCLMGAACRAGQVMAPSVEPVVLAAALVRIERPILGEQAPPSGPLSEYWRPPRTI